MMLLSGSVFGQEDSVVQKDLGEILINGLHLDKKKQSREGKKVRFSVIPVAPGSSGGKQLAVSAVSAAFYIGSPKLTKLSSISFIPYTNFSGTGGFVIRPNLWMQENKWNVTGELRLAGNYLNTYGLGANTKPEAETIVKYSQGRVYGIINRRVIASFYLGGGIDLDYFYNIEEQNPGMEDSDFKKYGIGTAGSVSSTGLLVSLLRDSRSNSVNPEGGFYTSSIYRIQGKDFGSEHSWSSFYFDTRKYFSLSEKQHNILAFWFLYWGTYGDVPYLNLPGTALDFSSRTGRGYSLGRYLGKQMLYGETEYRFDISANGLWGGVVFTNIQSYTELESEKFEYLKVGAGAGVRLKFDKKSNTNLTLDFGFGRDSFNVRLNLGEVF